MIKIEQKYLPSKKFIYILSAVALVAILVATAGFLGKNISKYDVKDNNLVVSSSTDSSLQAFQKLDSDNDTLPDWQETLYGTDPQKADTDGDGTNDANEMTVNRDPLLANTAKAGLEPNDKIDPKIIAEENKITEEYESLNATDKLARITLSEFIASQPTGREMTEVEQNLLLSRIMENLPEKSEASTTKISDLKIVDTSSQATKDYSNAYFKITEKIKPVFGKELEIMNKMLAVEYQVGDNKNLLEIIAVYKKVIDELKKIPVPSNLSINHLSIINILEEILSQDIAMANIAKDPVQSYSSFIAYASFLSKLVSVLGETDAKLNIVRKQ